MKFIFCVFSFLSSLPVFGATYNFFCQSDKDVAILGYEQAFAKTISCSEVKDRFLGKSAKEQAKEFCQLWADRLDIENFKTELRSVDSNCHHESGLLGDSFVGDYYTTIKRPLGINNNLPDEVSSTSLYAFLTGKPEPILFRGWQGKLEEQGQWFEFEDKKFCVLAGQNFGIRTEVPFKKLVYLDLNSYQTVSYSKKKFDTLESHAYVKDSGEATVGPDIIQENYRPSSQTVNFYERQDLRRIASHQLYYGDFQYNPVCQ